MKPPSPIRDGVWLVYKGRFSPPHTIYYAVDRVFRRNASHLGIAGRPRFSGVKPREILRRLLQHPGAACPESSFCRRFLSLKKSRKCGFYPQFAECRCGNRPPSPLFSVMTSELVSRGWSR